MSQSTTDSTSSKTPLYVTTDEAARIVGLSRGTLANRRSLGLAPRFYRVTGGRILYAVEDLHDFISAGLVEPVVAA